MAANRSSQPQGSADAFVRLGEIFTGTRPSRSTALHDAPLNHGFTDLERFNILRPGHLTVLTCEPTVARSSLLLNLALGVALRSGARRERTASDVLFITKRNSAHETATRIRTLLTGSTSADSPGPLSSAPREAIHSLLEQLPLFLSGTCRATTDQDLHALLGFARTPPPLLVVIEDAEGLRPDSAGAAAFADALQELAHQKRAAVLVATSESSDSCGSEQATRLTELADTLLELPSAAAELGTPTTGAPHIIELLIAKNHRGPTGHLVLAFHPATGRLRDVEFADLTRA